MFELTGKDIKLSLYSISSKVRDREGIKNLNKTFSDENWDEKYTRCYSQKKSEFEDNRKLKTNDGNKAIVRQD